MIRSIAAILAALHFAAPNFGPKAGAAAELQMLGARFHFDPITEVTLIEHESHWDPAALNPSSGARGLGQALPLQSEACRSDAQRCAEFVARLGDWRFSLRHTASLFATWREFCWKSVGTRQARFWLSGYGGWDATRGTRCGHRRAGSRWIPAAVPAGVRWILARRAELIRRIG